ncbi:hypothetical protein ACQ4WX_42075 [Streptomyces lasalocidi]
MLDSQGSSRGEATRTRSDRVGTTTDTAATTSPPGPRTSASVRRSPAGSVSVYYGVNEAERPRAVLLPDGRVGVRDEGEAGTAEVPAGFGVGTCPGRRGRMGETAGSARTGSCCSGW